MEDLKHIFDFLDKDRSGGLDSEELHCGLSILKLNLAASQIKNLMNNADLNSDGRVDFNEFVKLCVIGTAKDKIKQEDLVKRLSPYDKDGDGNMNVSDLRLLLGGEGEPLEEEDIDDVIRELDVDANGRFSIRAMVSKFLQ
jgi:Ca2+-binding EF-hand superfamily protein